MITINLIGNLTKDPEQRTAGKLMCTNMTVAVNTKEKGEEKAYFVHVSAFGAMGENCYKYLEKGSKIYASGGFSTYEYKTEDGKTGTLLQMNANVVEFLNSPSRKENSKETQQSDDKYRKYR